MEDTQTRPEESTATETTESSAETVTATDSETPDSAQASDASEESPQSATEEPATADSPDEAQAETPQPEPGAEPEPGTGADAEAETVASDTEVDAEASEEGGAEASQSPAEADTGDDSETPEAEASEASAQDDDATPDGPPPSPEEARASLEALCTKAEELAGRENLVEASAGWDRVQKSWNGLVALAGAPDAVVTDELLERFRKAGEALAGRLGEEKNRHDQRKKDNHARLSGLCKHLEQMLDLEELPLRKAERRVREAQVAVKSPGPLPSKKDWPPLKKRLETALEALMPKLRAAEEMDEWKRWANVPIQEELCERLEALVEAKNLNNAGKELRTVMEAWKKASRVPQSKAEELWERFKAARDKVRKRLDVHFAELSKERKANLVQKEALCEKAEAVVDSTEWNKTADFLKDLQAQWKKTGPVPREQSDAIWKRFRASCDNFFERRKAAFAELNKVREENLAKKVVLCEKAEGLAESTEWDSTTNALKALQAQWKTIGPVPRRDSDAIWKRFRGACDRFFDRRSRRDEVDLEGNLVHKEEAIQQLEALLPAPPPEAKPEADAKSEAPEEAKPEETKPEEAKAEETKAEGAEVEAPAEEAKAEEAKAEDEGDAPAETEEAETPEDAKAEEPEEAKAEEPAEAEAEASEPEPAKDAAPPEPPEDLLERIQAAQKAWKAAGEIPSNRRQELEERFQAAGRTLMETFPEALAGSELDPAVHRQRREKLCERLEKLITSMKKEAAAKEPSVQDLAAQLKQALASNTIRRGGATTSDPNFASVRRKANAILDSWRDLPGAPEEDLATRFQKARDGLTKKLDKR